MFNFIIHNKNENFSIPKKDYSEIYSYKHGWEILINGKHSVKKNPDDSTVIILGDIVSNDFNWHDFNISDLKNLKGIFYLIFITEDKLLICNSLFSILPIYINREQTAISSNIAELKKISNTTHTFDKKFILENTLFNYGFGNRTLYKEISLLPSNHYINVIKNNIKIKKHFSTENLFIDSNRQYTSDQLADIFIKQAKNYYPDTKHAITFTGGFDGRTLTALGKYYKKSFLTTSFGVKGNDDVEIPFIQSKLIELDYSWFDLHKNSYIKSDYKIHAKKITTTSPGFNGFLYPHFSYLAEQLSNDGYKYLLTGYFGSELFRALHISGAITSEILYSYFTNDKKTFIHNIRASERLSYLGFDYANELDELIDEVDDYFSDLPSDLNNNQKLYFFVMEEIFRKAFGTWINTQMQFLNIRAPFLDFEFIQALLKSKYAGANNNFATKNPFKRIKGQKIYAAILRKTGTSLYKLKTGKGYSPESLLNIVHSYKLLQPYTKKIFKQKLQSTNIDNLGIISGIQASFPNLRDVSIPEYFNKDYCQQTINNISPFMNERERDMLLYILSNTMVEV